MGVMIGKDPLILWPAPGFPSLLEAPDSRLDVLVASCKPDPVEMRAWAHQIALVDRAGKAAVPLRLEEVGPAAAEDIAEHAAPFAASPNAKGLHFIRVRLQVARLPAPQYQRTVQLFDLVACGVVVQPRCVAFFPRPGTTLNLAFVCDLHVAALWDEIAAAVDRHAPELGVSMINPNRLLERFIIEANTLAARGDLDLVVLGGDLVDHVHAQPRGARQDGAATNIRRLLALLERLDVPTLAVPGNHDYRCYPRRCGSSGLEAMGIPQEAGRSVLRRSGLWDRWPLSRRNLDALRTTDTAGMPGLSEYLAHMAAATDYCCAVRGMRLLCVSSGCDVLTRWREMEQERWGLLLRGMRPARYHPDSEGFTEAQLAQMRRWLADARGSALFFHAPLLAARTDVRIEERIARLPLEPQSSLAARVRFERQMLRAGFRCGVGFRNPGALIQELAAAPGPVVAFSGHIHRASALEIDRDTLRVHSLDPARKVSRSGSVKLLTAPALGQFKPGWPSRPGYYLARFADGELVSLQQRSLDNAL
jgi:hypothetical protein